MHASLESRVLTRTCPPFSEADDPDEAGLVPAAGSHRELGMRPISINLNDNAVVRL